MAYTPQPRPRTDDWREIDGWHKYLWRILSTLEGELDYLEAAGLLADGLGNLDLAGTLTVDLVSEHTPGAGVSFDVPIHVDTITENIADAGVTIEGVKMKDSNIEITDTHWIGRGGVKIRTEGIGWLVSFGLYIGPASTVTFPVGYNPLADDLIIEGSSDVGITLRSSADGHSGSIYFAKGEGPTTERTGRIVYRHDATYENMQFYTDNTRAVIIDSSQNLTLGPNSFIVTGTKSLLVEIGTPFTDFGGGTNQFAMYAADFAAGNACPYFRTENGTVIGLNQDYLTTASPTWVGLTLSGAIATPTDITLSGTLSDGTASLAGGSLTNVKLGSLTDNGFVKTGSGDGTLSVDTNTYVETPVLIAPVAIYFGTEGSPENQQYDITGNTWVISTDGTPNVAGHLTADCLTAMDTAYDGTYFNIREFSGGASEVRPLTVQFNFTGVTTFAQVIVRCKYDGSVSHFLNVELWNGASWDVLATIPDEADFQVHEFSVLNPIDYIVAGVVKLRMRHIQNGISSHHYEVDYLVLSTGAGGSGGGVQTAIQTPSSASGDVGSTNVQGAIDELAAEKVATSGSIPMIGDWAYGAFDLNIGEGGGLGVGGAALPDTILLETSDADDPTMIWKTTNTAHQINIILDESAANDRLCIEGQTASVDMHLCLHAQDGENMRVQLYSGATNHGDLIMGAGDNLSLRNAVQDKNIALTVNVGGGDQSITFVGATGKFTHSSGTFDLDDDNVTTIGTITGVNVTSGADPGHTHTIYEAAGAVGTHAALTTGTHGVGASTIASVLDIATHTALANAHHVAFVQGDADLLYHPLTTVGIADNNLVEIDGSPNDTEWTIFNAAGIEGLTDAEAMAKLSGGATAEFLFNTQKVGGVVDPTTDQQVATKKYVDDNAGGAWELIAETTVGAGGAPSITFSSIPATFTHLKVIGHVRSERVAGEDDLWCRLNNETGGTDYVRMSLIGNLSTGAATTGDRTTSVMNVGAIEADLSLAGVFSQITLEIDDYTNTNFLKNMIAHCCRIEDNDNDGDIAVTISASTLLTGTDAINQISITPLNDDLAQYSKLSLYGVK